MEIVVGNLIYSYSLVDGMVHYAVITSNGLMKEWGTVDNIPIMDENESILLKECENSIMQDVLV